MESPDSGYSIAYWSHPSEVKLLTRSSIQIHDFIIEEQDSFWKVALPPLPLAPPAKSSQYVCGENPALWDTTRWVRMIRDCSHGGFVFASGWTKWGNISGPFSKQERSRIMQHRKLSRLGPSYWKAAFLPFFTECAQEAYWNFIDTQRASGIIAAYQNGSASESG